MAVVHSNLFGDAVGALARDGMRSVDGLVARQEHLDDLVVVVVGGEDERRDVGRELALLVRTKERVLLRASTELRPGDVVGMLDHHLNTPSSSASSSSSSSSTNHRHVGWTTATLHRLEQLKFISILQSVQNMAARMMTGARRCDRVTPILEDLQLLPVSQQVVFKTALMVWKLLQPTSVTSGYLPWRVSALRPVESYWFCASGVQKFRRQRTDHLEQSAACTTSTRAVTEPFHTCTEDAPVLDRPAPFRRFTLFRCRI